MRTLVDIPDDDIEKLDALAQLGRRSRAAEIREAIRLHLSHRSGTDWIRRGKGYWRDRAGVDEAVANMRVIGDDRGIA
jgi:metal-responsive CopG/Arc/MetJ family transcriptional regulator